MNLRSCASTLDKCKSKADVSSILTPDLSDWRWNYANEDKLKARQEIWGI